MLNDFQPPIEVTLGIGCGLAMFFGHDGGDLICISSDELGVIEHVSLSGYVRDGIYW